MRNQVDVSVVIVNYKTKELTAQAIETLVHHCPWLLERGQIIVVDNASQDDSITFLKSMFPFVTFIVNAKNTGFSGGNNVGLKEAKGKYILLLNSDTITIEDAITPLVNWMEKHKHVGIASVQLRNEDKTMQPTGGYFPTLPRVFFWMFFIDDLPIVNKLITSFHPAAPSYDTEKSFYKTQHELDWVTGAFFLLRQDVLKKVGFFDEAMFMYAEEMEYCYRARQAGFSSYYVPLAKIIHLGGKSSETKATPVLGELKNIRYFYKKHRNTLEQIILAMLLKLGVAFRIVLLGMVLQRKEALRIYVQAFRVI